MIKKFAAVLGLMMLVLGMPGGVMAATVRMGEGAMVVGKDETIDDDLFVSGETVVVEGTVNGDVFAAGESVTISGTVNGDVYAGAGKVVIEGDVRDDVVVGTGSLSVKNAIIGDGVLVGAGSVILDEGTSIGGGLVFGTGMLESRAMIGRGVMGGGGDVTLDGPIGRDVMVGAGSLKIDRNASVSGNVRYSSDEELDMDREASISGTVSKIVHPEGGSGTDKDKSGEMWGTALAYQTWSFLAALVTGMALLWLAPPFAKAADVARSRPGKSILWGLIICVAAFPVLLALALTVVGLPLALIVGLALIIESYLAKLVVGLMIGNWLAQRFEWKTLQVYGRFLVGLLAYYVLTSIPVVGWLASMVGFLWGLGAIKMWKWGYLKSTRDKRD